ncbi:sortase [Bacillus mangrovi]|uniref:Sortase n=1 Tax=Metabacillus mangrovi TaxID=1491830 RepID=A0A7X2S238_9BACI|nr:class F sortase [Metabacillus mangrovi]MTH51851.1 sortase [Metabacillus mangrovi]
MAKRKAPSKLILIIAFLLLAGCSAQSEQAEKREEARIEKPPVMQSASSDDTASKKVEKVESEGVIPAQLEIPEIGVKAAVEQAGLLADGSMDVPKKDENTAWFENGAKPGDAGNAVIAGHVDSKTGPSVFYRLKELQKGDEILIKSSSGETLTFTVEKAAAYPYEEAPLHEIFGADRETRLNLITCTGEFDRSKKTHLERLVIYSKLKK